MLAKYFFSDKWRCKEKTTGMILFNFDFLCTFFKTKKKIKGVLRWLILNIQVQIFKDAYGVWTPVSY